MPADNQTKETNQVSKEFIFGTIASEAAGLYNLLITVSTGVFGATLLFLDRIAPSPNIISLPFLASGWLMLILCTVWCLRIRWYNLESGRNALEDNFDAARKIDEVNRKLTKYAMWFLVLGLILTGIFGVINIVHKVKINERNVNMVQENRPCRKPESKVHISERAIPYGSIKPSQETQQAGNDAKPSTDAGSGVDSNAHGTVDNKAIDRKPK